MRIPKKEEGTIWQKSAGEIFKEDKATPQKRYNPNQHSTRRQEPAPSHPSPTQRIRPSGDPAARTAPGRGSDLKPRKRLGKSGAREGRSARGYKQGRTGQRPRPGATPESGTRRTTD